MSKTAISGSLSPPPCDPPLADEECEETSSSSSSDVELDPRSGVATSDSDAARAGTSFELPARESLRHLTKRQRRRAIERAIARQRMAALDAAPDAVEVPLLQPRYGRERRMHRSMRVSTEGSSIAHANASEMLRGADQAATSERLVVTMGDTSFASNVIFDQPYALYRQGKRRVVAHSLGYGADGDLIIERSEVAALTSDGFTSDSNARSLLRQLRGSSTSGGRGALPATSDAEAAAPAAKTRNGRHASKGRDAQLDDEVFTADEVEAAKRVQLRRVQTTLSSAVCLDPRAPVPVERFQATATMAATGRGSGLFGAGRDAVSDAEACPRTAGMDRNLWRRKYPGVPCPKNRKVRNRMMNDFFVSEHTRPLMEAAREECTTRSSSRKRSSSIPAALYDAPPPAFYDNDVCSSMTGGDFFPQGFPSAFRRLVHRDEDLQNAAIHQMIRDADEAGSPTFTSQRRPSSAKKRGGGSQSAGASSTVTPKMGPVSMNTALKLASLPAGDGGEALKAAQRIKAQAQLADPAHLSVARFQSLPQRLRSELQHAMDATEFMPQFIRDVESRVRDFVTVHTTTTASAKSRKQDKKLVSPASSPTSSSATMTPLAALPVAVGASPSPAFPRTTSTGGTPMQKAHTAIPDSTHAGRSEVEPTTQEFATSIDVHCRDGYGRLIVHGISRFYGLVSKSEDLPESTPAVGESRDRPTTRGIHTSTLNRGPATAPPPPVLWGRITRVSLPGSGRVPPMPAVTLAALLTGKLDSASRLNTQTPPPPVATATPAAEETPVDSTKGAKPVATVDDAQAAAPKRFRKKRRVLPLFF